MNQCRVCAGQALERVEYDEVTFDGEESHFVVLICLDCGWIEGGIPEPA
jgi:hypothetical protein